MATVNTPVIQTPPASGLLSNTRGSNVSGDKISLAGQYIGPGGPSGIRVTGARPVVSGLSLPSAQPVWESAWVGQPATSPLPSNMALGCQSAVNYNGRVYVVVPPAYAPFNYCIAGVLSAEVQGGNVGSWRWENPVRVVSYNPFNDPGYISDSCDPGAICFVGNWLYVLGKQGVYYSYVLPDGRLANWALGLSTSSAAGSTMAGWQNAVGNVISGGWMGQVVILYNQGGGGGSPLHGYNVAKDGSIQTTAAAITTTVPVQRGYCALHIDPYGGTYVIGGEDSGGTPVADIRFAFIDYVADTVPGGWGTTIALPAARSRYGFTAQSERIAGNTDVFICGGQAVAGGAAQNNVYTTLGSNLHNNVYSWTTLPYALTPPTKSCAAALSAWGGTNKPTPTQQATPPGWPNPIYPWRFDSTASATVPQSSLIVLGGAATTVVQVSSATDFTRPWYSGPAPILTGSDVGSGSVVHNSDGSYTVTFPFADNGQGGFGLTKVLAALLDGDSVEIGVQFASASTGDTSSPATTIIKIGQPPTLSSVLPATGTISTGRPTGSFAYAQGAGGGPEAYWRITVTLAGSVVFDTDLRPDLTNSADINVAPYLLSGSSYTITSTAASTDTPYPGSSTSASASVIVTPSYTPPAAPT